MKKRGVRQSKDDIKKKKSTLQFVQLVINNQSLEYIEKNSTLQFGALLTRSNFCSNKIPRNEEAKTSGMQAVVPDAATSLRNQGILFG